MEVHNDLLAALKNIFNHHENKLYAQKQQAYMKSALPFFGIPKPKVHELCTILFKKYKPTTDEYYQETIFFLFQNATHRELWYAGLYYAGKFPLFVTEKNLPLFLSIIRLAQWWDIVDIVASNFIGPAIAKRDDVEELLRSWIVDENMWIRRTALLAQLRYKHNTNFALLTDLIRSVSHEKEFFIQKAIGWALREYSKTNPKAVIEFVSFHNEQLSGLAIREALRLVNKKTTKVI